MIDVSIKEVNFVSKEAEPLLSRRQFNTCGATEYNTTEKVMLGD